MLPIVSVVITTKNEENNIENCIRSVKNQSYSSEIIEQKVAWLFEVSLYLLFSKIIP